MLEKYDPLSINQTAAQIKLQEAQKANRDQDYPISLKRQGRPECEEQLETQDCPKEKNCKKEEEQAQQRRASIETQENCGPGNQQRYKKAPTKGTTRGLIR